MGISEQGLEFIKRHEGFNPNPFINKFNRLAIGYGSTHYENGTRVRISDGPIERLHGDYLLRFYIHKYEECVRKYATFELQQHHFDILVSFCYSVGLGSFKSSGLLRRANEDHTDTAVALQFVRWNKIENRFHKDLAIRRQEEANIFFYGY